MNSHLLIAGGPYLDTILVLFLVFIVCPILTVTFFIAAAVQRAKKERKRALVFDLLGLLFALPLLVLGIMMWIRH